MPPGHAAMRLVPPSVPMDCQAKSAPQTSASDDCVALTSAMEEAQAATQANAIEAVSAPKVRAQRGLLAMRDRLMIRLLCRGMGTRARRVRVAGRRFASRVPARPRLVA